MTDTERLDWLEEHTGLLNTSNDGPHVCIDDGRDGHFHAYGKSYRGAIDAAKAQFVPHVPDPENDPLAGVPEGAREAFRVFRRYGRSYKWLYEEMQKQLLSAPQGQTK